MLKEGRRLAPAPGLPATGAEWLALPAALDAYLKDHFGLRQALIRAHKDLTKPMLGTGSDSVLVGRDGRMFYLGEEAVRQSAGLVLRDARVASSVDLVAAMNAALARRGVRFLVASPPNGSTVYQDDLPDWAQNHGRPHRIRPLPRRARRQGRADGRPSAGHGQGADGRAPPTTATTRTGPRAARSPPSTRSSRRRDIPTGGSIRRRRSSPPTPRKGGDLARLLGQQDAVSEEVEDLKLTAGREGSC